MCTLMVSEATITVHQSVKPYWAKFTQFTIFFPSVIIIIIIFTTAAALETNGISSGDQENPQVIKYIKKLLVTCMF